MTVIKSNVGNHWGSNLKHSPQARTLNAHAWLYLVFSPFSTLLPVHHEVKISLHYPSTLVMARTGHHKLDFLKQYAKTHPSWMCQVLGHSYINFLMYILFLLKCRMNAVNKQVGKCNPV